MKYPSWTKDEDAILAANWHRGLQYIYTVILRTPSAILQRAFKLKLRTDRKRKNEDISSYLQRVVRKDPRTGCWNWQKVTAWGYGRIRIRGKTLLSHRVSFHVANPGVDISALQINHRCDNRACINPEHLYAGTAGQNVRDMIERGRANYAKGEGNNSKLRECDIPVIRFRVASGQTPYSVAKDYGVDPRVIGRIAKREKWRHVP